ncbi:ATP-dependent DNA ligase [Streptomyces sp. NPDC016562]|uniref:ATP-dependent DNA ligase n=1 Tax=Streptomyces sp. NPDC016562 TaxID=3364966 RepID=UPI0036F63F69
MASGFAAEQKFDGHRAILFTPASPGGRLLLQTRRGSLVQDRFPDLGAAAEQLPDGLVLDGELVVWDTPAGRLSFEALQRRVAARGRTATALAAKTPAFFIAFDALRIDGTELLALPYAERRRRLEVLFAARPLTAPWTLCPMDPGKAREWLEDWTDVSGVEGLVVKALDQRYRHIGAIIGALIRPPPPHFSVAATRPAVSVPSAASSLCAPTPSARSPNIWPPPAPSIPGPARGSPRHGEPATSWTPPWVSPAS